MNSLENPTIPTGMGDDPQDLEGKGENKVSSEIPFYIKKLEAAEKESPDRKNQIIEQSISYLSRALTLGKDVGDVNAIESLLDALERNTNTMNIEFRNKIDIGRQRNAEVRNSLLAEQKEAA